MLASALVLALVIQTIVGNPVEDQRVDYSQHKLIRIRPQETSQLYRLEELRQEFDGRVDYWNHPMTDMRPVLSLISPSGISFLNALNSSKIKYEIAANNFQTLIDSEMEQNQRNKMLSTFAFDYETVYHTYAEILAELKALPSQSSNVKYIRVGTTYQGREIGGITISNGNNLPAFILECGIHAREWVTPAACLWIANQLITNSAESKYLSRFNWVIVPSLNSDGYYYTWNNDRMWRKTRSPQGTCYGVDPNRNWNAAHCQTGASTSPCSDTYCGPSPHSESEVKAMADLVLSYGSNIAAYISVHSYSQLWMYPYGYSTSLRPSNEAQLRTLTNAAIAAVKASSGLTFTGGPIATTIYVASGGSIDWAYDKAGVKVTFALELRDTGRYGFQLPPDQILPASRETWAGIKAIADGI